MGIKVNTRYLHAYVGLPFILYNERYICLKNECDQYNAAPLHLMIMGSTESLVIPSTVLCAQPYYISIGKEV